MTTSRIIFLKNRIWLKTEARRLLLCPFSDSAGSWLGVGRIWRSCILGRSGISRKRQGPDLCIVFLVRSRLLSAIRRDSKATATHRWATLEMKWDGKEDIHKIIKFIHIRTPFHSLVRPWKKNSRRRWLWTLKVQGLVNPGAVS